MVRDIVKDVLFLGQKSVPATKDDLHIATDLQDTLRANHDKCVGMAANMIGYHKNIIIVSVGFVDMVMINPVIKSKSKPYQTEEGCLSLLGVRPVTRFENITVEYEDCTFKKHVQTFNGWTAQIIQHEVDHCNGIII